MLYFTPSMTAEGNPNISRSEIHILNQTEILGKKAKVSILDAYSKLERKPKFWAAGDYEPIAGPDDLVTRENLEYEGLVIDDGFFTSKNKEASRLPSIEAVDAKTQPMIVLTQEGIYKIQYEWLEDQAYAVYRQRKEITLAEYIAYFEKAMSAIRKQQTGRSL